MIQPRDYQQKAHDAVIDWVKRSTEPCVIEAPTGCHAAGHPILMHDGTIKPVEDISVGDVIMGPDGEGRTVLRLHRGTDEMFSVRPTKGEKFSVNAGHIFSLYKTPCNAGEPGGNAEVTAADFYASSKNFKHTHKLERCAVEFQETRQPVPPWIIGVMIGDGCVTQLTPTFCTADIEVLDGMREWAKSIGCEVHAVYGNSGKRAWDCAIVDPKANRLKENRARALLKQAGIYGHSSRDKFVPHMYKTASRFQRLELLAGILDTDGCLSRGGYDWISASERLADDVVYLCRSLGLAAYKAECRKSCQNNFTGTYFRVSISGDCSVIPCRVPRRIAPERQQVKRVTVTGFTLEPEGQGEYFGFEIDKDHLYLDGFFVRHHNSGKSIIIAMLASTLTTISNGKHVLCLAPRAELVVQNREKYLSTGEPASVYSASAGQKCLKHPVVFATPGTFKGKARAIGGKFCAVVLDEAHGITPTVKQIIEDMRASNSNLRVIGLSATPYRLGTGYIYQTDETGRAYGPDKALDPYFAARVLTISARELLERGFLTPPAIGKINAENYETLHLELNKRGQFDAGDVDRAFIGHGRKTALIVADVVAQARDRHGVMLFAATVQHAKEVLDSLPQSLSAIITGATTKAERGRIIEQFKAQKIKYLVNVDVLTTGFDADHVDVIALLRATESVSLLQQIIGRGLRIRQGKADCLVLDYAQNIDRHCPDGDVFNPTIKTKAAVGESVAIEVRCPLCSTRLEFTARPNPDNYDVDAHGYFTLYGQQVETEHGPMPAHFGRRCYGLVPVGRGLMDQCSYRWTSKPCPECNEPNDIAARYCCECKAELVDPNDKLIADFKAAKKDPHRVQIDRLIGYEINDTVSQSGQEYKVVHFNTEYRSFPKRYMPWMRREWQSFMKATQDGTVTPETITYRKNEKTNFYDVLAFNMPADTPESISHDAESLTI